ncbi:Small, acid-soluble spore protein, alpha/beta type [Geosporobacter subterraneus DSM 17957]|uniref:Small, acid-soluble spore protein, alpha/beta type n=1 Tax=Geosporobacter subterraneus DSM 17957 TaxID=1121919 RepID=A0A1M6LTR7_9FIRM|nr:small, acid-soluble spore protein, alpha/beta type [Geosporobacter subterraneus]SHJ74530.1 Small, acid-soluble spore protein, alpha/beta type [Geosporobacter subterraneus DSM 17957]
MSKKNSTKNKKQKIETIEDVWKYEIAEELGLLNKVKQMGWGGLTAKETGRIGGLITVKKKQMNKEQKA